MKTSKSTIKLVKEKKVKYVLPHLVQRNIMNGWWYANAEDDHELEEEIWDNIHLLLESCTRAGVIVSIARDLDAISFGQHQLPYQCTLPTGRHVYFRSAAALNDFLNDLWYSKTKHAQEVFDGTD